MLHVSKKVLPLTYQIETNKLTTTMKKTSKSAKIKKAETIIGKLVDLQYANNGWCPYLQDAQRSIRKYIENIK